MVLLELSLAKKNEINGELKKELEPYMFFLIPELSVFFYLFVMPVFKIVVK